MLTTREVAERLAINTSRVRQLIIRGQLKAEKHGRDWMIKAEEVERYKRERRPVGRPRTLPNDSENVSDRNEPPSPVAQS